MTKTTSILLICLGLCACDQEGEQTKATEPDTEHSKLLAPLPTDPALALAELEKRLDASVKVSDGLVIVRDPVRPWSTSVLPITTPWVLNCGFGVSVVLGTAVSGDATDVSNSVDVTLSFVDFGTERL